MFGGEKKKLDEADDNFPWILSDLNGFLNRREKNKRYKMREFWKHGNA